MFSAVSVFTVFFSVGDHRGEEEVWVYRLLSVVIPSLHEREMFALLKSLQPKEDTTERICAGNESLV